MSCKHDIVRRVRNLFSSDDMWECVDCYQAFEPKEKKE